MNFGRTIPQEIIFEIISWLPAKSLMRFKCVTKFCKSLVSESNFVDIYECRSMTRPSGTKFFVLEGEAFYAVEQKEDGNTSLLRIKNFDKLYDRPGTNCFEFVNGLFCFWKFLVQPVAICNPSTTEVRFLPHLNLDVSQNNCYYSLGYEPEEKKYKVLLMTPTPEFEQGYYTRNWIFTLGIDETWREAETVAEFYPFTGGVCINGVNYMFNTYTFESVPILHNIVAFEVRAESFRIITWYPRDREAWKYQLIELKGKLAIIDYKGFLNRRGLVRVWISKDTQYEEWDMRITIGFPLVWVKTGFSYKRFLWFHTTHDRNIVFGAKSKSNIISYLFYDVTRKKCGKCKIHGLPKTVTIEGIYSYVENLFPLRKDFNNIHLSF